MSIQEIVERKKKKNKTVTINKNDFFITYEKFVQTYEHQIAETPKIIQRKLKEGKQLPPDAPLGHKPKVFQYLGDLKFRTLDPNFDKQRPGSPSSLTERMLYKIKDDMGVEDTPKAVEGKEKERDKVYRGSGFLSLGRFEGSRPTSSRKKEQGERLSLSTRHLQKEKHQPRGSHGSIASSQGLHISNRPTEQHSGGDTTPLLSIPAKKSLRDRVRRKSCTCQWCGGEAKKERNLKLDEITALFERRAQHAPEKLDSIKIPDNLYSHPSRPNSKRHSTLTSGTQQKYEFDRSPRSSGFANSVNRRKFYASKTSKLDGAQDTPSKHEDTPTSTFKDMVDSRRNIDDERSPILEALTDENAVTSPGKDIKFFETAQSGLYFPKPDSSPRMFRLTTSEPLSEVRMTKSAKLIIKSKRDAQNPKTKPKKTQFEVAYGRNKTDKFRKTQSQIAFPYMDYKQFLTSNYQLKQKSNPILKGKSIPIEYPLSQPTRLNTAATSVRSPANFKIKPLNLNFLDKFRSSDGHAKTTRAKIGETVSSETHTLDIKKRPAHLRTQSQGQNLQNDQENSLKRIKKKRNVSSGLAEIDPATPSKGLILPINTPHSARNKSPRPGINLTPLKKMNKKMFMTVYSTSQTPRK